MFSNIFKTAILICDQVLIKLFDNLLRYFVLVGEFVIFILFMKQQGRNSNLSNLFQKHEKIVKIS